MKLLHTLMLSCALIGAGFVSNVGRADRIQVHYESIRSDMLQSVVRIEVESKDGKRVSGSGVCYEDHKILTAGHLFDYGQDGNITVYLNLRKFGAQYMVGGKLLKIDRYKDIAIIESDEKLPFTSEIDTSNSIQVGDPILVVGAPLGFTPSYTSPLSYLATKGEPDRVPEDTMPMWSAAIWSTHGNSGCPVFDANTGKVIGIVSRGPDTDHGLTFFVSTVSAKKWFK